MSAETLIERAALAGVQLAMVDGRIKVSGDAAAVAGLLPRWVWAAESRPAFTATSIADALKVLDASNPKPSTDIAFKAPDIAENGAVVPIGATSKIPKTESISILVEKNPSALSASFNIPDGTEPTVSTRVKMGQTSNVYALVKADGKYFYAVKEVKVTLGGCGG